MLKKITSGGYFLIRIMTAILAGIFFTYSLLTLWDMYRTEIKAFASYDLLQYRPDIENDEPPYLDELLKINPDTAGWVTIYGTNIDYPVMRGEDDKEYLNKSATGEYSISGSVFMSCLNSKDFSDPYTLLYGHHMDNGSMFGDIDKFKKDKDFFYNKEHKRFDTDEGVLIMQNKVWNLKVIGLIETSAYDNEIYRSNKTQEEIPSFVNYAKEKAMFWRGQKEPEKILALSTCASATSFGRTVLLCRMEVRTDPLPTREAEPLTPHRKAAGHPMAGAYWALLNLVCLLTTIFFVLRLNLNKERISLIRDKNRFIKAITAVEVILAALSILLFMLTEDLHKPIQIVDIWTLPMIILFAGIFGAEQYHFRKKQEDASASSD